MTKNENPRRKQFKAALKTARQTIENDLNARELRCGDPSESLGAVVIDKLDASAERCYDASLECITPCMPAKDYKQKAVAILLAEVDAEWRRAARIRDQRADAAKQQQQAQIEQSKTDLESCREAIEETSRAIDAGVFPGPRRRRLRGSDTWRIGDVTPLWQGADVIIAAEPLPACRGSKTVVITPHAAALTLLFYRLRDACSSALDHMTRYEFYGRMAEAVNGGQDACIDPDEREVLHFAVTEAANVIRDWQRRLD